MSSRRVLLTGGAGFIGSHLAEALLSRDYAVAILDNLDDFYQVDIKRRNLSIIRETGAYTFYEVDVRDLDKVRSAAREFSPDIVVHLAARAGVRPSLEVPWLYEAVNVGGTCNVLEVARGCHVSRVVFGSSSSVYGDASRAPFSEDEQQLRPISPYAATKIAGELFCHAYAHLYGITVLCLRFFTVYGPRQRPDLAIHRFTRLLEAGRAIPIFGDGSSGRDYTYVDDIVNGIMAALDYEPAYKSIPFEVFNLGNSHPVTLNELVQMLETKTGRTALRMPQPPQPGDVLLTWADITKSRRLLNYQPRVGLADGLERFVAWYRSLAKE